MQQETFTVVYDGPALSEHTMDVRDLAPALLSLSHVFDEARQLLYGDNVEIRLHVKALEAGCFSVDIAIVQSLVSQMKDLLNGEWLQAALTLKELIVGGAAATFGLIKLIKKLRGSNPSIVKQLPGKIVRIEFDGETLDIPLDLLRLYQDINIRRSVEQVVAPLSKDGITSIEFKGQGIKYAEIEKAERSFFDLPEIGEEEILRVTRKAAFSIVSLAFREENKWRLHDGNNTIFATIKDEEFLYRVEHNETAFRKSDVLICEVEDISTRDQAGLKTEHNVIKVLEHRPAMRQIPLRIETDTRDS